MPSYSHNSCLNRLRRVTLRLPEVTEAQTWGHPTFKAGKKAFAVLEEYDGHLDLALKVGLSRQEELLADPRFIETPYCGHQGWASLHLDTRPGWREVEKLVVEAYRFVALKRMLQALEAAT